MSAGLSRTSRLPEAQNNIASRPGAARSGRRPGTIALAAVLLVLFAVPLFIGLGRWDMRNDESIYSYAVLRILDTGDWLTPRSIPTDWPFLEKPPLKFWIVAGAMSIGLTPVNEYGLRVFDALFGTIAFGYVLAFGWRLAGPLCGAIALLVLFTFNPLIFDHGFRSNNMEAALFLAYCGGLFHFWRWLDEPDTRARRRHAVACALYFCLGFMTKFVAAMFLPMAALVGFVSTRQARERALRTWTDWLVPAAIALVIILPWFIYQTVAAGSGFWSEIFATHVYRRFTTWLDPSHLQPWHFYFTYFWREFEYANSLWVVLGGLGFVTWKARLEQLPARLLLAWWLVPLALISVGSSKLGYYAYPYLPPLALAAGWLGATAARVMSTWLPGVPRLRQTATYVQARPVLRSALLVLAAVCAALAAWSVVTGHAVTIEYHDIRIFRSSSIARPLMVIAAVLFVTGAARPSTIAVLAVLGVLPLDGYGKTLRETFTYDYPLRAAGECLVRQQDRGRAEANGVYLTDPHLVAHPPFYYFRHAGPWTTGPDDWQQETVRRILNDQPVILGETQWSLVRPMLPADMPEDQIQVVSLEPGVLMLLPGPYRICAASIVSAGGQPLIVARP